MRVIQRVDPDEIYNFGGHGAEAESFDEPEHTLRTDALGALHFLESLRLSARRDVRYLQATSAAVFGTRPGLPVTEATRFEPTSPYAVAKACGHWMTRIYRDTHGLFACSAIFFDHESPLRGRDGPLRRISRGLATVLCGGAEVLALPALDTRHDIGCARDFVHGAWLMLQQATPADYVLATGEMRSLRELVSITAEEMGLGLEWRLHDGLELGVVKHALGAAAGLEPGRVVVRAPQCDTRREAPGLQGDARQAFDALGWAPTRSILDLAREMAAADLDAALRGRACRGEFR
ncbi:GDP-mannose 4,6-dehydratase, partial [Arthrospira platensis SPKY1]|nr:GDP-mannose 4,6-dehydratase [Arthrospira platensis SPKY1]